MTALSIGSDQSISSDEELARHVVLACAELAVARRGRARKDTPARRSPWPSAWSASTHSWTSTWHADPCWPGRRTTTEPPEDMMRDLTQAKFSFVTRGVADRPLTTAPARRAPSQGDLVVARVARLGQHGALEDQHGRRVRLYPDDLMVGAYGNRYATDF